MPDDLDAAQRAVLTPAGGVISRGAWEYRCAQTLAEECGRELLELPGAHNGMITHPRATAEVLRTVL